MKRKQVVSLLLTVALVGSSIFSGTATLSVSAKETEGVTAEDLTDKNTARLKKTKSYQVLISTSIKKMNWLHFVILV